MNGPSWSSKRTNFFFFSVRSISFVISAFWLRSVSPQFFFFVSFFFVAAFIFVVIFIDGIPFGCFPFDMTSHVQSSCKANAWLRSSYTCVWAVCVSVYLCDSPAFVLTCRTLVWLLLHTYCRTACVTIEIIRNETKTRRKEAKKNLSKNKWFGVHVCVCARNNPIFYSCMFGFRSILLVEGMVKQIKKKKKEEKYVYAHHGAMVRHTVCTHKRILLSRLLLPNHILRHINM